MAKMEKERGDDEESTSPPAPPASASDKDGAIPETTQPEIA